jgi:hypothetical protein
MTDVFEPTDHGLHYYVLPKDDPVEALNSSLRIERGLTPVSPRPPVRRDTQRRYRRDRGPRLSSGCATGPPQAYPPMAMQGCTAGRIPTS